MAAGMAKEKLLSSEQGLDQKKRGREEGRDRNILINIQNWGSLRVGSLYTTSLPCTNLHLTSVIMLQEQLKVIFTPFF